MTTPIDHPRRCKARSSRTGHPCRKWAMKGMAVCRTHGGATAHARRTARERLDDMVDDGLGVLRKALRAKDLRTSLKAVSMLFRSVGLNEPDRDEWVPASQVADILRTIIRTYGETFLRANEMEDHDDRVRAWLEGIDTVARRVRTMLMVPGEVPLPEPPSIALMAPPRPKPQPEVMEL